MAGAHATETYSTQSGVGSVARSESERLVVAVLRLPIRSLTALIAVGVLTSCASAGGSTGTVDVEGRLMQAVPGAGDTEGWILQTDAGVLPLELLDGAPPRDATCVTVQVPDDFGKPSDPAEVFAALNALAQETGDALPVSDYC
jgi:hypothetical protein